MMLARSHTVMVFAGLATLSLATGVRADNPIDSEMDSSLEFPTPRVVNSFPKDIAKVWIQALDRPVVETKVAAAQSIALAHRLGMTELNITFAPLTRELDRPGQHPTVRLAVVHALVTLDARQTADSLFRQLDADDADLRELVEPALARWDYQPVRTTWLARLGENDPYRRRHLLAIRGLGEVRDEKAVPSLRKLATNGTVPSAIRLEAARALAKIRQSGLEEDAAALAADHSLQGAFGRLIAASLLRQHQGDEAVRLLQALARDSDPTVGAVALARLMEIDTKLIVPILEPILASSDANVRAFGVEVLFRQPTDGHIKLLGDRLSDAHPEVRSRARVVLRELAAQLEFRGPTVREGIRALGGTDWRGQEQAAILLGHLDHKSATKRLLELLRVERGEAMVAAAWALRQLAVPDTLPAVLEFVRAEHLKLLSAAKKGRVTLSLARDQQLSQLVQFMGKSRFQSADALLREMLPRLIAGLAYEPPQTPLETETRTAAVWALGLLHEGKPDPALVVALQARITDAGGPNGADSGRVRGMAAVSLARMKATDAVPTLRRFYRGKLSPDPVNNACGWALAQITGEPLPPPATIEQIDRNWFLSGID